MGTYFEAVREVSVVTWYFIYACCSSVAKSRKLHKRLRIKLYIVLHITFDINPAIVTYGAVVMIYWAAHRRNQNCVISVPANVLQPNHARPTADMCFPRFLKIPVVLCHRSWLDGIIFNDRQHFATSLGTFNVSSGWAFTNSCSVTRRRLVGHSIIYLNSTPYISLIISKAVSICINPGKRIWSKQKCTYG